MWSQQQQHQQHQLSNNHSNIQSAMQSSNDSQSLINQIQYASQQDEQLNNQTSNQTIKQPFNEESRDRVGNIPTFSSNQTNNPSNHQQGERYHIPSSSFNSWSPSINSSTQSYRDHSIISTAEPSPHGSNNQSINQSNNHSNNGSAVSSPSSLSHSINSRTQSLSFAPSNSGSRRASGSSTPLTQPSSMSSNVPSVNLSPHRSSPPYFQSPPSHSTSSPSHQIVKSEFDNNQLQQLAQLQQQQHLQDQRQQLDQQQHQQFTDDDDHEDDDQSFEGSSGHQSVPRSGHPTDSPIASSHDRGPSCVIECGRVGEDGERVYLEQSAYFDNQSVEIYQAANDPRKRTLYRAAQLSEKFNCATNKVGMYLARRRNQIVNSQGENPGLYQATSFRAKPSGRSGLKAGGYFVSIEVCKAFQKHYETQLQRKKKASSVSADQTSVLPISQPAQRVSATAQAVHQQQQQYPQVPFSQALAAAFQQYSGQTNNPVAPSAAPLHQAGSQLLSQPTSQLTSTLPVQTPEQQAELYAHFMRLQQQQQLQQLQQQQGLMRNTHSMNQPNALFNPLLNGQVMNHPSQSSVNQTNANSFTQMMNDRMNPNYYNPAMMNQSLNQSLNQYPTAGNNQAINQYGANNTPWNQYQTPNQSMNQYPADQQQSNQYLLNQQQANQYLANNQANPSSNTMNQTVKQPASGLPTLPLQQHASPSYGPTSLSNQLNLGSVLTPMNQSSNQPGQPAGVMNQSNQSNQSADQQARGSAFPFSPQGHANNPISNPQNNSYQSNHPQNQQYHNGISSQFYPPAGQVANSSNNQFARFPSEGVSPSHISPIPYHANQAVNRPNNQSNGARPPSSSQFGQFHPYV